MKYIYLLYFYFGGMFLFFRDLFAFKATFNDCAGDVDGKMRLEAQMVFDCVKGFAYYVYNTTQLSYLLLTAMQRAAFNKGRTILHGNLAPRGGQRGNGTSFCIAHIGRSWVIATAGGRTWSALVHFGLVSKVYLLNFPACIDFLYGLGIISEEQRDEVHNTQFRSLLLSWLLRFHRLGFLLPGQWVPITEVCDEDLARNYIENQEIVVGHRDKPFPNTYLLMTADDLGLKPGHEVEIAEIGVIPYVEWLSDVPEMTLAMFSVSAGYDGKRLLGISWKCEPDENGIWPDPLPEVKVGQSLVVKKILN